MLIRPVKITAKDRNEPIRLMLRIAVLASVVFAFTISGCGLSNSVKPRPLSVVILLDETSFADTYWSDSIKVAQAITLNLGAYDRLQINAISDSSGGDENVLLNDQDGELPVVFPAQTIFAKNLARKICIALNGLHRRVPQGKGTDIVGALRSAADVFNRNSTAPPKAPYATYEPVLVILSDMRPDFRDPKIELKKHPFAFPPGAHIRCLFVTKELTHNARSKSVSSGKPPDPNLDWHRIVRYWQSFFSEAGLKTTELDYKKVEESRIVSPTNAPDLRNFIKGIRYKK